MKTSVFTDAAVLAVSLFLIAGCGTARKLNEIKDRS